MFTEKKQINHKNQGTQAPKGTLGPSSEKTKLPTFNSFLQKIISVLKKEELI